MKLEFIGVGIAGCLVSVFYRLLEQAANTS